MIKIVDVSKIYGDSKRQTTALSHLSCELPEKGFVCIVGESGCGKTTLLNILSGFDRPTEGKIFVNGQDISLFGEEERDNYHNLTIGFVFQNYNVLEELTVCENVGMSLDILNIEKSIKSAMIDEALKKVGILEKKFEKTRNLSGGEKQRVAIARAYVKHPGIILADEPTGNLDTENSNYVFEMLKELSREILVVVVTHDKKMAYKYSDRILTLTDGCLVSDELNEEEDFSYLIENNGEEFITNDFISIKEFVDRFGRQGKDKFLLKIIKNREVKSRTEAEKKNEENTCYKAEYSTCRLSVKDLLHVSNRILSKRRVREVITAMVFSLTLFLLIVSILLFTYNHDIVVSQYLEQYQENTVFLEKHIENSGYEQDYEGLVGVSEDIYNELIEACGEERICKKLSDCEISTTDNVITLDEIETGEIQGAGKNTFVELRVVSNMVIETVYKSAEVQNTGIYITDSVAGKLGINASEIGRKLYIGGEEVTLGGIISANVKGAQNDQYRNYAYVSQEYMESILDTQSDCYINIQGNNFFEKSLFGYIYNSLKITGAASPEYDLISGELPKNQNEIVISEEIALEYGVDIGLLDSKLMVFDIKDLDKQNFSEDLSQYINLYEYLGEQVTVVGIASMEADVMVCDTAYKQISNIYYDIYYYDALGVFSDEWEEIIEYLHDNDYQVVDKSLNDVYLISEMKSEAIVYILLLLIIMITITLLLFVSFISYNVKDNSRLIGILRSMGVTWKDVKRLLMVEPLIIIIISIVIAITASLGLVHYINLSYLSKAMFRQLEIIIVEWHSYAISAVGVFCFGIFSAWLPIVLMDKKEIIDLIKEN